MQESLNSSQIDLLNLPPNARALTKLGRPYNKLAEELHTMLRRREYLINEYKQMVEKQAALMNELVTVHVRIDQILDEASPEGIFPNTNTNANESEK